MRWRKGLDEYTSEIEDFILFNKTGVNRIERSRALVLARIKAPR